MKKIFISTPNLCALAMLMILTLLNITSHCGASSSSTSDHEVLISSGSDLSLTIGEANIELELMMDSEINRMLANLPPGTVLPTLQPDHLAFRKGPDGRYSIDGRLNRARCGPYKRDC